MCNSLWIHVWLNDEKCCPVVQTSSGWDNQHRGQHIVGTPRSLISASAWARKPLTPLRNVSQTRGCLYIQVRSAAIYKFNEKNILKQIIYHHNLISRGEGIACIFIVLSSCRLHTRILVLGSFTTKIWSLFLNICSKFLWFSRNKNCPLAFSPWYDNCSNFPQYYKKNMIIISM